MNAFALLVQVSSCPRGQLQFQSGQQSAHILVGHLCKLEDGDDDCGEMIVDEPTSSLSAPNY